MLSAVVAPIVPQATDKQLTLIAAGPVTKQPNTSPYRTVLLDWGQDKYSVHEEVFNLQKWQPDLPLDEQLIGTPSSLTHGDYFTAERFVEATIEFARRIQAHAQQHVGTIYKELAMV